MRRGSQTDVCLFGRVSHTRVSDCISAEKIKDRFVKPNNGKLLYVNFSQETSEGSSSLDVLVGMVCALLAREGMSCATGWRFELREPRTLALSLLAEKLEIPAGSRQVDRVVFTDAQPCYALSIPTGVSRSEHNFHATMSST